jgi:glycine hydroxymethyltransferase
VSDIKITANKNTVPFDPESPFITSGLRLGSAALTTRGFDQQAFEDVGNVIADRLLNPHNEDIKEKSIKKVIELCNKFPLYCENI